MNQIEIYYDGVNMEKYSQDHDIKGFTTNISFLKSAGICDYDSFIKKSLTHTKGRPVSFQLYDDTDKDIEATARKICSYDKHSIFVKIPVIKTNGESNFNIIKKIHNDNLQINVTAIFTKEQIDSVKDCFGNETPVIISIFGGRINDSGLDCSEVVKHAVDTFKNNPNIKILWAACRTVYNMFEAQNQGAHIVTVPDSVLSRMNRIGDDTYEASIKTVKQFRQDGIDGNIKFN
jgi:transaldolase|tara:strand:+ start:2899 stop:3597 length:699 start_codon:yes stop_codon:yes gene_type:complete